MTDSDKITIAGIVVNIIINIAGWFVFWFITKKASQITLAADEPTTTPKKKRKHRITPIERRLIRDSRLIQAGAVLFIINEIWSYVASGRLVSASPVGLLISIMAVISFGSLFVAVEVTLVKALKNGTFVKRYRKNLRSKQK